MLKLIHILGALRSQLRSAGRVPPHVGAFIGWIVQDTARLREALDEAMNFEGQTRHPEHVSALGYGSHADLLSAQELQILRDEMLHLGGRAFFAPGRPPRFEVDGIGLLGVSLGTQTLLDRGERAWLTELLRRSSHEVESDPWQLGLVRLAKLASGDQEQRIIPPDLAIAAAARGLGSVQNDDLELAWKITVELAPHASGPARDAVRLAVFQNELHHLGQASIASPTRDDLVTLLQNVSRGMKRWTFEQEKRTANSGVARWDIENEYHVQNLLWVVLAPVFPDLDDEENLPSIGHKKPRADLGVSSLRTIVEVKFIRDRGQRGFAKVIDEIAADTSLYLSRTKDYDNIVAFVWDDCSQTEQHHELKTGIEQIRGVSAAIVLSRPSAMRRQ